MKNKVVVAVLAVVCVASVACNVYQYNMLNASKQQLSDAQTQLNNMTSDYTDLDAQLVAMQEELDALNINMADKQSEIDSLAKENSDLVNSISELEESIEETKKIAEEKAIETAKAEQTASTQTTETASTTTNQSTATGIDDDIMQKMEANGFSFTNGTDGMNIVEVANDGAGVDMSNWTAPSANWE